MSATQTDHDTAPGARPAGTFSPGEAAQNIQQMFSAIAPTYDRANHILSAGIDRSWWNRTARTLRPILQRPEAVVLDLCCGTGDMTLALDKHRPNTRVPHVSRSSIAADVGLVSPAAQDSAFQPATAPILALDFSHTMLTLATRQSSPTKTLSPSKPTLSISHSPTTPSTLSPPPSASATSPATPTACANSTASYALAARSPSSNATSPPVSSAGSTPSTSTTFCPRSAALSPASPAPTPTCPTR